MSAQDIFSSLSNDISIPTCQSTMNFTLGIHPKLRKFFKPKPQPPIRPRFKPKFKPDPLSLKPRRLDIRIQATEPATSSGSKVYRDMVYLFLSRTFWAESVFEVGYEVTEDDPMGRYGFDIMADLFDVLNGRLDIFRGIYIDVPESSMERINSGNLLGLAETPRLDSKIKLDNAFFLREFKWSGNLDLLKDKFQVPFSRLTFLSLLRCKINVDDACLLLVQCHDLRGLEIGTITRTESNASTMPTTWWRHFRLRFMFLESLSIISECLLLEFTSRLALNDPKCGLKLKTLSLTLLTQNASRRISELDFPWSRLKTVNVEFEIGVVIPSVESLRTELVDKAGLGKSAKLRINEAKIKKEKELEAVREVEVPSNDLQDGDLVSELDDLDFGTTIEGDRVSLLTLPD